MWPNHNEQVNYFTSIQWLWGKWPFIEVNSLILAIVVLAPSFLQDSQLLCTHLKQTEDFMYNWVDKKLYFTHRAIVGAFSDFTSGNYEILIDENEEKYPNGLVVDPYAE